MKKVILKSLIGAGFEKNYSLRSRFAKKNLLMCQEW